MDDKNTIEKEIIAVLGYFDYFKFPLKLGEIHTFIRVRCELVFLKDELAKLVQSEKIYLIDECYLLTSSPDKVERKRLGFENAQQRMVKAKRISKFIMRFPFVRMVSISGSLSKGYSDAQSDIDFFIVTTENQLWTARTILHLFKKLTFLVRMEHSFCMNYFIAENKLLLDEKNYFTAVELATLLVVCGEQKHTLLLENNRWITDYLPNFHIAEGENNLKPYRPKGGKWLFEKLLSAKGMNRYFMNLTDKKWRRKWKNKGYPSEDYPLAFKTTLYESKNHPGNNQKKLLTHIEKNKWTK